MKYLLIIMLLACSARVNAQFIIMNPGVPVHAVEVIRADTNGHVVFGTDNGILIYHGSTWQHFGITNGLSYNDVKAIGLCSGGFFYSTVNKRLGSCNYVTASDAAFSVPQSFNYISAISINTAHDTLYGTDGGQVYLHNGATSGLLPFVPLGYVTDIGQMHNPSGAIDFHVIATTNQAVIYQVSSGASALINTSTTPIPSNDLMSHTIQGAITYDGTDKGLYIANFNNYPSVPTSIINTVNAAIPSDTISAVAVKDSMIFLGTPKGLAVFAYNIWHTFDTVNSNLPANAINRLAVDTSNLWIGTQGGHICRIGIRALTTQTTTIKSENSYSVFPNPANDNISVNMPSPGSFSFLIFDEHGRNILTQPFIGKTMISTCSYPDGIYLYQVIDADKQLSATGKLIIKH